MSVGTATEGTVLRRLARDQWVRLHGTPRVTVLVGGAHARDVWVSWLALTAAEGRLFDASDVEAAIRDAIRAALDEPTRPVAVLGAATSLRAWRSGRADRDAAMIDEGWLEIDEPSRARGSSAGTAAVPVHIDARSAAEAALFEALEATPSTRGRFLLNESLSVRFGSRAAEVDLLSRTDRIAIEIDGIHHFADADCYRRDRRKDLLMQTQGLLVVRLLAEDVLQNPRDAVNVVVQALAYRLAEAT